mgnify:CR=1 FL=1
MDYTYDQLTAEGMGHDEIISHLETLNHEQLKDLLLAAELPLFSDSSTDKEDSFYCLMFDWIKEEKGEDYLYSL